MLIAVTSYITDLPRSCFFPFLLFFVDEVHFHPISIVVLLLLLLFKLVFLIIFVRPL